MKKLKSVKNEGPDSPDEPDYRLSPKQVKDLAEIEAKGVTLKIQVADLTEQILMAEERRVKLFQDLYQVKNEYQGKVTKIASQLGIDVDADPKHTGERFDFQPADGRFVRIPVTDTPTS